MALACADSLNLISLNALKRKPYGILGGCFGKTTPPSADGTPPKLNLTHRIVIAQELW